MRIQEKPVYKNLLDIESPRSEAFTSILTSHSLTPYKHHPNGSSHGFHCQSKLGLIQETFHTLTSRGSRLIQMFF